MVAAVSIPDNEVLIDTAEANKHLRLLGYGDNDPIILCAYGEYNSFHPRRHFEKDYDWNEVTRNAAKNGRAGLFHSLQKDLLKPETPNAGFISSPEGTCTTTRNEIKKSKLVIYEIDDEDIESQWCSWEIAGLPDPTAVLDSGNRSLHVWYLLDDYITADEMTNLRARVSETIYQYCGFKTDSSMHSCHQPTRLAGVRHPKGGRRAKIVYETGNIYSYKKLIDCTEEVKPKSNVGDGRGELWRPDVDPIEESKYPKPDQLKIKLPITVALSNTTKNLIKSGVQSGEKLGNRYNKCFSLSETLQAARLQLEDLGYQVKEGHVEQLYKEFCSNSNLYEGNLERALARHFRPYGDAGFTCGELSKSSVKRAIAKYCFDRGHWQPPKTAENKKSDNHLSNRSLPYRKNFFEKYTKRTVKNHRNSITRFAYLRDVLKKLNLNHVIKDSQLNQMIMTAQDELAGNVYRSINAAERVAEGLPEFNWLIEDRIPANDLTIIGGRPKVGKTRLAIGLARCLLTGEEFLGIKPAGLSNVILITDDQSDADSGQMMKAAGIYEHPNLYWSKKFRYTESELNKLLLDIKYYENPIVIKDSFRSITRSTGLKENDAATGVILYDLKQAITEAGGTFILLHHCNKDNAATGTDALSGNTAIAGAANTILTVHYLSDKDTNKLLKSKRERRIVREARSGNDFDLVATLQNDNSFNVVCSFDDLQERQLQEDKKEKINNQLKKVPKCFESILHVMYKKHTEGEAACSIIELMKEAKLCKSSAQIKKDLSKSEENNYVTINRKIKEFTAAGLVVEMENEQLRMFAPRRRALALTEAGADLVSDIILDY